MVVVVDYVFEIYFYTHKPKEKETILFKEVRVRQQKKKCLIIPTVSLLGGSVHGANSVPWTEIHDAPQEHVSI